MENLFMRMKVNLRIILLSLVFLSVFTQAQSNTDSLQQLTAEQELKIRLANLKTFKANFSQTVTDLQGQVLQQANGLLQLQQPNQLYWELFEPNESVLIADGESLWNIDPFVEQATVFDQQQAIESNPMVLLAQPNSDAWNQFSISKTTDSKVDSFRVEALSDDSQIAVLIMSFIKNELSELSIIDRQQQTSQSVFSDIQQNLTISPNVFKADIPEGYEVDDQR
ncbi:outer membrane lipoprotein chaperone LolA [Alteromonadaceae bacterium M269]|nr:outer membrane lipoprotein chaperone LolA [Alteromonadaceae bacterium M269]